MKTNLSTAVFLLFAGNTSMLFTASAVLPETAAAAAPFCEPAQSGPTVNLRSEQQLDGSAIEHFMYFIPLISPVPVTVSSSTGSTQRVHMLSLERTQDQERIALRCAFEIKGAGFYHNNLDQTRIISRHADKIRRDG